MSKTLMFQRHLITTSSSKIKACSLPNVKHRYLFSRNQILHSSNIKFKARQNYIHVMAKAGKPDDDLQAPIPTRRPSSEWKQWVAGIVFSMFIPSYTPTIGTLANLKNNIGTVLVTLVTMAEMVESTTGVGSKLADMAKQRAKSIEEEKAKQTQELMHQVEKTGNGVKEMMESSSPDVTDNHQETGHEDRLVKRFP
ncbi:hypothetical protein ACET3Z_003229 [Daucus carota]